jgi:glycosyltransferase involved in cell wall biosynthesis
VNTRSISVVIPAYQEAKCIVATLRSVRSYLESKACDFEIIVVADGTDGTRELARGAFVADTRVKVIGSADRRGKGRGVREGVALASGEVVGFVDADDKTPITEFDKFERCFDEGADIVIGSRGLDRSLIERQQPVYRRLGSRIFAFCMHSAVGLRGIADTQCGFKFFRRDVARRLFARQRVNGYMFDVEILFMAERAGYSIRQVPVRWRDDGDSRLALVRGNLVNALDIMRIATGRFRSAKAIKFSVPLSVPVEGAVKDRRSG